MPKEDDGGQEAKQIVHREASPWDGRIGVRQRKINYCCEAKRKWISPWGKEKINIAVRCKLPCRWNEINYCREAKRKLITPMRCEWNIPMGRQGHKAGGDIPVTGRGCKAKGNIAVRGRSRKAEGILLWGAQPQGQRKNCHEGARLQGQRDIAVRGCGRKAKGILLWGGAAARPKGYCWRKYMFCLSDASKGHSAWWSKQASHNNQQVCWPRKQQPRALTKENVIKNAGQHANRLPRMAKPWQHCWELSPWWTTPEHHLDERRMKWALD